MADKHAARQATILCYAHKCIDGKRIMGEEIELPTVKYTGEFDCQGVADSVPVPVPETALIAEHKAKWKQLYSAFARAWAVH